jgi:hypothetical protein
VVAHSALRTECYAATPTGFHVVSREFSNRSRASCVLVGACCDAVWWRELTCNVGLKFDRDARRSQSFDKRPRFVLDIAIFSPIIYIWYEGGRLRQRIVNL